VNWICNFLAKVEPTKIETWLKITALLLAALFFTWKICVGWFAANLNLSIASERVAKDEASDFLAISVTLDKGTTDSVYLKDISLRLAVKGQTERSERIRGFERLPTEGDRLLWPTDGDASKESLPEYLLAQGESLQLAKVYEVPSDLPATVEVAVLAKRAFYRPFQWRAVHISLPKSDGKGAKS
jgi:hypothetical protein